MVSKISASGNYGGAEIFETFFFQGQANFPPQPSVVGRKILNFFLSMLTKISASGKCGGAEIFENFFF
jgi:hypothetical protein